MFQVFHKMMNIRRRTLIRFISYASSIFIFLGIATYVGYNRAIRFRTELEYTYQAAISQLGEDINNIDIALEKGIYAGTNAQLMSLSSKIFKDASNAKISLSHLPVSDLRLEKTYHFLSQVGDFTISVSRRLSEDEKVTEEERDSIAELSTFAKSLSGQIAEIQSRISSGSLKISEVKKSIGEQNGIGVPSDTSISDGFKGLEEGFTDFPTLIYDGPFSDHISQMTPRLTEGKSDISQSRAKSIATEFLGVKDTFLGDGGETEGRMPTFNFQAIDVNISVTKKGGFVSYFVDSRQVPESKISHDEALEAAKKFLSEKGYSDFENNYFQISNNICIINFNLKQNGFAVYTDIIKIGVAMDNGQILSFDAQGYIMNHKERNIPAPKITKEEAADIVSSRLKIDDVSMAVIPSMGLNEIPCYEFLCTGEHDEKILVYVNIHTKKEEQLLVLLESEEGTLTI